MIASKIAARDLVHRHVLFNPEMQKIQSPGELMLRGREVETERRTWPHRRISGNRAVDEETTLSVKKERIASCDLCLTRSQSESPSPPSDDAMVRLRDKRVCVEELAVVPLW